ncbi:hypothetical protein JHD49_05785 [Sulfurimonas sp. SAG-AH-194-C21]|nr:methyltransferase [Sulfurimonas sp. SAG-AH-194-C21]MDF1883448.1 hypothetical protein [Sulfurimonas sp. SAG-AH-194-C21]
MSKIFEYQVWHFIALVLSVVVFILFGKYVEVFSAGSLFGVDTLIWFALAVFFPLAHQLYVAVVWRLELYKNYFSSRFGWKRSFLVYRIGFSLLFGSRLVFIIFLAYSNRGTLLVDPFSVYLLVAFITPIVAYLFYSVVRYFTIERAYGIDHFDKEYDVPYVKEGIFRFTDNGMYIFGLLILYIPALLLFSKVALVVAVFNHLYIWVHYFTTEKPDMQEIYGQAP